MSRQKKVEIPLHTLLATLSHSQSPSKVRDEIRRFKYFHHAEANLKGDRDDNTGVLVTPPHTLLLGYPTKLKYSGATYPTN